jgi:signal peptidase
MSQNNAADDTELYAVGQTFLNREEDVIGSVVGYVPLVRLSKQH